MRLPHLRLRSIVSGGNAQEYKHSLWCGVKALIILINGDHAHMVEQGPAQQERQQVHPDDQCIRTKYFSCSSMVFICSWLSRTLGSKGKGLHSCPCMQGQLS
eukprot:1159304-Pelagomonas_calceolata.AAC.7